MIKLILLTSALAVSTISIAQTPAKAALCAACHGQNGDKPLAPNYPKINNQNVAYLVASIQAYKKGERTGGLASVMAAQAKNLTDKEINELANYYSKKP